MRSYLPSPLSELDTNPNSAGCTRVSRLEPLLVVSYLTCRGNKRQIPLYVTGYTPWEVHRFWGSAITRCVAKVKTVCYCTLRLLLLRLYNRHDFVCVTKSMIAERPARVGYFNPGRVDFVVRRVSGISRRKLSISILSPRMSNFEW